MKTGTELIALERERQKLRYTSDHDDGEGELLDAAVAYVDAASYEPQDYEWMRREVLDGAWAETGWPQDQFRPKHTAIENLVIAGALIAAEIDRLQHLNAK